VYELLKSAGGPISVPVAEALFDDRITY
jgi:hypothetical protein